MRKDLEAHAGERGYRKRLADAGGLHPTYLSQVISGKPHLTLDHGIGIGRFWKLDETRLEYFLATIELAKAATPELADYLRRKLADLRSRAAKLSEQIEARPAIQDSVYASLYASQWYLPLIHILTGIPKYQRQGALAKLLGHEVGRVVDALTILESMGLVHRLSDSVWERLENNMHTPTGFATSQAHANWRHLAGHMALRARPCDFFYSSVNTVSRDDVPKIQELVNDAITKVRKKIIASGDDLPLIFSVDLFEPL